METQTSEAAGQSEAAAGGKGSAGGGGDSRQPRPAQGKGRGSEGGAPRSAQSRAARAALTSARARAPVRPPSGSPRAASRDRAQPRRQRRPREHRRRWQRQREAAAPPAWSGRRGAPSTPSAYSDGSPAGPRRCTRAPRPGADCSPSCSAVRFPVCSPRNPGPRPGLHPARCCSGRRRGAGRGALPSAARPERGFAEPRRRVLRGRERPLGDRRALGGGRPGAASSSSSATAAASSRCSVSREPRLVDAAEALGSAAAALSPEVQPHLRVAPRAQRAGLRARPETPTPPSPVPPNPSRLAFLDSSLGKMVPAAGEMCASQD
ncbi:uncharacterized protein LOC142838750 [Microtus pennsylvanicus]|uniref:uncharacterized protein LOC142838750 n=1 Tax=Microtus pennsylvanicus TaxID=10058 RepID=UPI003F6CBA9D